MLAQYLNTTKNLKFLMVMLWLWGQSTDNTLLTKFRYIYWRYISSFTKNLPFWSRVYRTPSIDIALNPEWENKIDTMAAVTSSKI